MQLSKQTIKKRMGEISDDKWVVQFGLGCFHFSELVCSWSWVIRVQSVSSLRSLQAAFSYRLSDSSRNKMIDWFIFFFKVKQGQ